MAARKLIIFEHDSRLGRASSHSLFEHIVVRRKDGSKPAREFGDYEVIIDEKNLPTGVTLRVKP